MKQSDEWLYSTHLSLKDAGRQIVSSVEVVVPCELEGTLEVNGSVERVCGVGTSAPWPSASPYLLIILVILLDPLSSSARDVPSTPRRRVQGTCSL